MTSIPIGAGVTLTTSASVATVGVAGETGIVAGSAIYQKVSDSRWYRAQATVNMADATVVSSIGIALTPADAIADAVTLTTSRNAIIDLGASLTDKSKHYLITTDGTLAEYADLASSSYVNWWGLANGTNFIFAANLTGVTK